MHLHRLGKETGDCRKACGSALWPHSSAAVLRLSLWLWGLHLASAAPRENRFSFCPAGSEQSRNIEQGPGLPPAPARKKKRQCHHNPKKDGSLPAGLPLSFSCFSVLLHRSMTCAPHHHLQPPSLLFSKTGIILHIFFPSPKIGERREQLIWSSCWFCYLTKILFFLTVIFSLVFHHICTTYLSPPPSTPLFTKPPSLESRECVFLSFL